MAAEAGALEPAIILVEPQIGENIGMVARAMANFALSDLRLVAPRQGWPSEAARKAASGADRVVDGARIFATLEEAISDLRFCLATTARQRDMLKPVFTPKAATREIRDRLEAGENCGILFGREAIGLTNDQVALADGIVTAPVNPEFASLNLAQSVLLVGYEWYLGKPEISLGRKTEFDGPVQEGLDLSHTRPAERKDLFGLFDHLESELDDSGYFPTPERRVIMVRNLRNMFHRMQLTEQDVGLLRGVVAALSHTRRSRSNMS